MLKKLIRKVLDRLFLRKFDDIKVQKGQLFERHLEQNLNKIKTIEETFFKVFSQDYEDGIIQYLIKSLNLKNIKFVEVGTQDYSESNTRYIFETMRCEGLIIDPTPNLKKKINAILRTWKNTLKIHNDFINSNNVVEIIKKNSLEKNLDIFSLDIDGIDYWILEKLPKKIAKIFIVEYNPYFGSEKEICAPNIECFDRFKYHPTGFCWGASLKAIIKLMKEKGYTFIGTNNLNVNSFFVQDEFISRIGLKLPDINDLSKHTEVKFNVLKNKNGKLVSLNELYNDIQNIKVYNLNKQKLMPFNET
tara:strand:+ start:20399 stop:21310 length:912 start_codon:yes stop_codon:yes gene_type:complete